MTTTLQKQFLDLACRLSPENLSCDGMLNKTQVVKRYNQINSEWAKLEKEAGRKVTEDEVWGWNLK